MEYGELLYLCYPGEDIFCGYGLSIAPDYLVGVVAKDAYFGCPGDLIKDLEETFGECQLMTITDRRITETDVQGIICQMKIPKEDIQYLKPLDDCPITTHLRFALQPLIESPPRVTLYVEWEEYNGCWTAFKWIEGMGILI